MNLPTATLNMPTLVQVKPRILGRLIWELPLSNTLLATTIVENGPVPPHKSVSHELEIWSYGGYRVHMFVVALRV